MFPNHCRHRLASLVLSASTLLASPAFSADLPSMSAVSKSEEPTYVCPGDPEGPVFATPGFCGHDERIRRGSALRVAVLLFEGAQLIDFTAPMEIFGQAGATVFTVAPTQAVRSTSFGLKVMPDYDFDHAPPADVLLVPGGKISEIVLKPAHKAWLVQRVEDSRIVLAVCTGTFILGCAGLLDGLPATTFAQQIKHLKHEFPSMGQAVSNRRYVDTGKIITTAGLSAGVDGALHVIGRWYGRFDAQDLARGIEYDWVPERRGSFGELMVHQMPHWPAVVPAGSSWQRFHEKGDSTRWETRAHVGFESTPATCLDQRSLALSKQAWRPAAQGPLFRSFMRSDGGRRWHMRIALSPATGAGGQDLSLSLVEARRAGTIRSPVHG